MDRAFVRVGALILWLGTLPAFASSIDTGMLERPWPRQRVRELEVGRYDVRWRERLSKRDGLFVGVRFHAPLPRQSVWERATNYTDIGTKTPGVTAIQFLEQTPTRQVIQLDVKVLWKALQLTFEVEQDPPKAIRFQLRHSALGEYRGLCVFEDEPPAASGEHPDRTAVELTTWLKPAKPVPLGLLLIVERITLLQGVKEFLQTCEQQKADSSNSRQ